MSAGRDRVSASRNSVWAGRDLPFQFDKSQNLLFSFVFGFKTIIFDKFIVYYHLFIVFYRISIKFLSFTIEFLWNTIKFYRFRTTQYVKGIL